MKLNKEIKMEIAKNFVSKLYNKKAEKIIKLLKKMENDFYEFSEVARIEGYSQEEINAFQNKLIVENCDMYNGEQTARNFETETEKEKNLVNLSSQCVHNYDLTGAPVEFLGCKKNDLNNIASNLIHIHYGNTIFIFCKKPNKVYLPGNPKKKLSFATVKKLLNKNNEYKAELKKFITMAKEAKCSAETIIYKINKYKTSDKLLKDYPEFEKFLPQKALIELRNGPDQSFKKWINSMIKMMEEGENNEQ